jgi:hypothetical protein
MEEGPEPKTPEEYIERYYRIASDRRLAGRLGWSRAEVARFLEGRGLRRTAAESEAVRTGTEQDLPPPSFGRSGFLYATGISKQDWLLALGVAGAAAIILWLQIPGVVSGHAEAATCLDVVGRGGWDLALFIWRSLAMGTTKVLPGLEPAHALQLLSVALISLAAFVGALDLRGVGCSGRSAATAALVIAAAPVAAVAGTECGPASATPALVLLAVLTFNRFRRSASWIVFVLMAAVLFFLGIHISLLDFGALDLGFLRSLFLHPLGILALLGLPLFFRGSREWFGFWVIAAGLTLLARCPILTVPFLVLPAALALERLIVRLKSRPAISWGVLALVLGAAVVQHPFQSVPGSRLVARRYGDAVLQATPLGSTVYVRDPHLADLLRYLKGLPGWKTDVELAGNLPAFTSLPKDRFLFLTGFRFAQDTFDLRPEPHGLLWSLGAGRFRAGLEKLALDEKYLGSFLGRDPQGLLALADDHSRPYLFEVACSMAAADPNPGSVWLRAAADLAEDAASVLPIAAFAERRKAPTEIVEAIYERARKLEPRSPAPVLALARSALERKDLARAKGMVEEALRIDHTLGEPPRG